MVLLHSVERVHVRDYGDLVGWILSRIQLELGNCEAKRFSSSCDLLSHAGSNQYDRDSFASVSHLCFGFLF